MLGRVAALLVEWAMMEAQAGDLPRAQELLARASRADPSHAPAVAEAAAALKCAAGTAAQAAAVQY